jgi:hypothetical protein
MGFPQNFKGAHNVPVQELPSTVCLSRFFGSVLNILAGNFRTPPSHLRKTQFFMDFFQKMESMETISRLRS